MFILGDWRERSSSLQPHWSCRTQIHPGGLGAARGSQSRAGQVRAVQEQEIPAAPHGRDYRRGHWGVDAVDRETLLPDSAPKLLQTHGFNYKKEDD